MFSALIMKMRISTFILSRASRSSMASTGAAPRSAPSPARVRPSQGRFSSVNVRLISTFSQ